MLESGDVLPQDGLFGITVREENEIVALMFAFPKDLDSKRLTH